MFEKMSEMKADIQNVQINLQYLQINIEKKMSDVKLIWKGQYQKITRS
jgi:hypothetical protein